MTHRSKYSMRALRVYLRLCPLMQAPPRLTPRRVAVLALAIAATAWLDHAWNHDWQYHFRPRSWYVVEDGRLYRSGQIDPRLVGDMLREHHIRVIVALTKRRPGMEAQDAEDRSARELGIEQFRFPLEGNGTGDVHMYEGALKEMVKAVRDGKPCLVHCGAGTERAGAATYFYRVLVDHWPAAEAGRELVACGSNPRKNGKLVAYLDAHVGDVARALAANHDIDRVPDPLPRLGADDAL